MQHPQLQDDARGVQAVFLEYEQSASLTRINLICGKQPRRLQISAVISGAGDTAVLQEWKRCGAQLPVTSSCLAQVSWTETDLTPTVVPKQATSPSVLSSPPWEQKSHPAGHELRSANLFYGGSDGAAGATNGIRLRSHCLNVSVIVDLFKMSFYCHSTQANMTGAYSSSVQERLERRMSKDLWVPRTQS